MWQLATRLDNADLKYMAVIEKNRNQTDITNLQYLN